MKLHKLNTILGLALAMTFTTACTRDAQRGSARGNQSTDAVTSGQTGGQVVGEPGDNNDSSAPVAANNTGDGRQVGASGEVGSDALNKQGGTTSGATTGSSTNFGGSQQDADQAANNTAPDASIPRDDKGIPGSSFASNIKPSTTGRSADIHENRQPAGKHNPAVSGTQNLGSHIDVTRYPFSQKDDFKSLMQARLKAVENGLTALRNPQAQPEQISQLRTQRNEIAGRLAQIDNVQPNQWESTKSKFRDEVMALEKSYGQLQTAGR